MIPSILADQTRRGIEEFLRTTFPITTPFFDSILEDLITRPEGIFKGPFLTMRLPYQKGITGKTFFPGILPDGFHPYRHQEISFERLGSQSPKSTIVATGTGSGKTECFLYPHGEANLI
nr:helicase with metal-binding cysteine cluster [Desulfobulbaceae bacterium]